MKYSSNKSQFDYLRESLASCGGIAGKGKLWSKFLRATGGVCSYSSFSYWLDCLIEREEFEITSQGLVTFREKEEREQAKV